VEFHTFVDFLIHNEGVGYLIGLAVLLTFIPFWGFLTAREKD